MPWKAVTLVWPAIVAALLPLDLHQVITRLPRLLARIAAFDVDCGSSDQRRNRPRQVQDFQSRFSDRIFACA